MGADLCGSSQPRRIVRPEHSTLYCILGRRLPDVWETSGRRLGVVWESSGSRLGDIWETATGLVRFGGIHLRIDEIWLNSPKFSEIW